jgi:DNA-binding CsgD family transcriptional regulator
VLTEQILGEIAVAGQGWEATHHHLCTAEAHARREGLAWELARILEAQAFALTCSGRGRGGGIRPLLEEALGLYEGLGDCTEAARLRERLTTHATRGRHDPLPAGLTRREAEVLRLVVIGLSNHDIADALDLSEKTVEHHLTRVYVKIGADNRAAAAAFAVRHGLA